MSLSHDVLRRSIQQAANRAQGRKTEVFGGSISDTMRGLSTPDKLPIVTLSAQQDNTGAFYFHFDFSTLDGQHKMK